MHPQVSYPVHPTRRQFGLAAAAVAFVGLAFLSLSFFIDFIDQLGDVGQGGYTVLHATLYSLLLAPGHFYEVAPIAVLIGTGHIGLLFFLLFNLLGGGGGRGGGRGDGEGGGGFGGFGGGSSGGGGADF